LKKPRKLHREIGLRIKSFRERRRISQAALGEAIGVSYQQVQKYESGVTPLTIERLEQIATALKFDPADLLSKTPVEKVSERMEGYLKGLPGGLSQDEVKLLKLFRSISSEGLKKSVFSQVKGIATVEKELKRKGRS
jgi:transcriptional regulator with XRE-family HTH domain